MASFNGQLFSAHKPNKRFLNKKNKIPNNEVAKCKRINKRILSDIKEEIEEKVEEEGGNFHFLTKEAIFNQNLISSNIKLVNGKIIYENIDYRKQIESKGDISLKDGNILPEHYGKIKNEFLNKPLTEIGKKIICILLIFTRIIYSITDRYIFMEQKVRPKGK